MAFENVSNELLDFQRDCNDVIIALKDVQENWYALGTQLNISRATLARILHIPAPDGTHFKHLSELISAWIRRERREDHPSWRQLCQALYAMKQWDLAEIIAQKHSIPGSVPAAHKDKQTTVASTPVTKGKNTVEYRVFTKCYSDIQEAMINPLSLADELLPEGFITHPTHRDLPDQPIDQQRRNIMRCVSVKIAQDSSNLHKFMRILEGDGFMDNVVSTMKQQLPKEMFNTTTVPHTAVNDGEDTPDCPPTNNVTNGDDNPSTVNTPSNNDKPTDKRPSSVNNVWFLLGAAVGGAVLVAIIAFIIHLARTS